MVSFGVGVACAGPCGLAGLVSVEERLVAEHAGKRHTATFNADGDITVDGHPEPVATPNQAVALVSTTKVGGWQLWGSSATASRSRWPSCAPSSLQARSTSSRSRCALETANASQSLLK